jgi:hypothetical protein
LKSTYLPTEPLGQEPSSHSSYPSLYPSQLSFQNNGHGDMIRPRPKGILIKRSVSDGLPKKEHDHASSHHRQTSLSLCRVSGKNNRISVRTKEGFTNAVAQPSMQTAQIAAVQAQSTISTERELRIMNVEWSGENEAAVALASSFEPANPRRTVSFAPVHQIRQPSISESRSPTFNAHHPNGSFHAGLPRVLQAGIRPSTPERQGVLPGSPALTPRQLGVWEEEELGVNEYQQHGYFERPSRTAEEAHIHSRILDKRMKEIASGGTWSNSSVPVHATSGYVAAMRRQQYANVATSFRHPQCGLSKNAGECR